LQGDDAVPPSGSMIRERRRGRSCLRACVIGRLVREGGRDVALPRDLASWLGAEAKQRGWAMNEFLVTLTHDLYASYAMPDMVTDELEPDREALGLVRRTYVMRVLMRGYRPGTEVRASTPRPLRGRSARLDPVEARPRQRPAPARGSTGSPRAGGEARPDALPPDNELWDVHAAARFVKRSVSWVYHRAEDGTLPVSASAGWGLRFIPTELRAWVEASGEPKRRKATVSKE
jgi:hypothetical protein